MHSTEAIGMVHERDTPNVPPIGQEGSEMDCPRFEKWIGRCRFEPRYDLSPADLTQFTSVRSMNGSFAEMFRRKTYVRDVCIRCGKTIERAMTAPQENPTSNPS